MLPDFLWIKISTTYPIFSTGRKTMWRIKANLDESGEPTGSRSCG
jgi:hypothetical protein